MPYLINSGTAFLIFRVLFFFVATSFYLVLLGTTWYYLVLLGTLKYVLGLRPDEKSFILFATKIKHLKAR